MNKISSRNRNIHCGNIITKQSTVLLLIIHELVDVCIVLIHHGQVVCHPLVQHCIVPGRFRIEMRLCPCGHDLYIPGQQVLVNRAAQPLNMFDGVSVLASVVIASIPHHAPNPTIIMQEASQEGVSWVCQFLLYWPMLLEYVHLILLMVAAEWSTKTHVDLGDWSDSVSNMPLLKSRMRMVSQHALTVKE